MINKRNKCYAQKGVLTCHRTKGHKGWHLDEYHEEWFK